MGARADDLAIQNVVASATIGTDLDLNAISASFEDAEYEPEQFPGLVLRLTQPKTAALIFRSGKVVCTGAKSVEDVHTAVAMVQNQLRAAGFPVSDGDPGVEVQNIVCTADLKADLNLNAVAIGLGLERVEYEPEQFPGLVYRLTKPKVVVLIFGSGKLVCTGAKALEHAADAVQKIRAELQSLGLM